MDSIKMTVDIKLSGRKFDGWGTSLCWWANRVGYSDKLTRQIADLFFSKDKLGLNIMRYNIGGGDAPDHHHITRTDSAVPGWKSSDSAAYDVTADRNQLNALARAYKAAGEDAIVEVFSNSPPYYMTVSGCSSGNADPAKDNLREDAYEDFAEYMAFVTKYIVEQMNIKVTSLSPMNEPSTDFWWANNRKQEGCHFDLGNSQSRIITETANALKAAGLSDIIIAASDETGCEYQYNAYMAYSDTAKAVIGRINTHTYDENGAEKLGKLSRQVGFELWMSETDGGGTAGENAGEMAAPLWFAKKIIRDINALSPSAWIMWQIIDSHISKDGYNGNKDRGALDLNSGYWGLAVADHDHKTVLLTQKYYVMGQFSRYIRPQMTILHIGENALAAYDEKSLCIVAVNDREEDIMCDFELAGFSLGSKNIRAVRTSGDIETGEHWAELGNICVMQKSGFSAKLKANSVTTFIAEVK